MTPQFITYAILLLAICFTGVINYKKLAVPFRILTLLCGCVLISEAIAKYLAIKYHNNMPLYHIYGIIELVLYLIIYYLLFTSELVKKIIIGLIILMIIFSIYNSTVLQPFKDSFPSNILLPAQIIYVVLSLLLFKQMLTNTLQSNIFKQSIFWFTVSMFFFSSTMFLYLGLLNYFVKNHLSANILYTFSWIINLAFYALLGLSIILNSRESKIQYE